MWQISELTISYENFSIIFLNNVLKAGTKCGYICVNIIYIPNFPTIFIQTVYFCFQNLDKICHSFKIKHISLSQYVLLTLGKNKFFF